MYRAANRSSVFFAGMHHAAGYATVQLQISLPWVGSVHVQALHNVCQAKAWHEMQHGMLLLNFKPHLGVHHPQTSSAQCLSGQTQHGMLLLNFKPHLGAL
jgi:hypothetical protein